MSLRCLNRSLILPHGWSSGPPLCQGIVPPLVPAWVRVEIGPEQFFMDFSSITAAASSYRHEANRESLLSLFFRQILAQCLSNYGRHRSRLANCYRMQFTLDLFVNKYSGALHI
jgi:hypothetical protein